MRKFLVITAALALLFTDAAIFAEAPQSIRVTSFTGNAFLVRRGQDIELNYDSPCEKKDLIQTEAGGELELAFYDFAGARLAHDSECYLAGVEESKIIVQLNKGQIMVNMKTPPSGAIFQIDTEFATATVKGTQFLVRAYVKDGKPAASFAVARGTLAVTVKKSGGTVNLVEGAAVDVDRNAFIPSMRGISEDEGTVLEKAHSVLIAS